LFSKRFVMTFPWCCRRSAGQLGSNSREVGDAASRIQ
jgi:hypothetical protein